MLIRHTSKAPFVKNKSPEPGVEPEFRAYIGADSTIGITRGIAGRDYIFFAEEI